MTRGKCRAIVRASDNLCTQDVTHIVTFKDGDTVETCGNCAQGLQNIAATHGSILKIQKLSLLSLAQR
jgi:hypothetical protein